MPVQIHGSSTAEFTWTVIPIIILVALFIPSLILVIDLKTPPAEADADVTINVVGHQWWWEFDYPKDGIKVQATPPNYDELVPPVLVVPVDKTIVADDPVDGRDPQLLRAEPALQDSGDSRQHQRDALQG